VLKISGLPWRASIVIDTRQTARDGYIGDKAASQAFCAHRSSILTANTVIFRRPYGCSSSVITRNAPRPAWLLITSPELLNIPTYNRAMTALR
jgi:hypothetical protein